MSKYSDPFEGITVTFAAPDSGASGTFSDSDTNITTAITNASGIATAAIFTANITEGSYTVDATASGLATPAEFQLINSAAWYVSTTGNDTNDCFTTSTPCLTINAAIGKAASGNVTDEV